VQQPAITSTFNNATGEGVKRDYLAAITATLLEKSICNAMIRNLSIWLESVRHHGVTGSETPCPITILKTEITYSEIGLHCQEEMFLIQKRFLVLRGRSFTLPVGASTRTQNSRREWPGSLFLSDHQYESGRGME
jgi:hypothetical protein